jgi:hypothetical protein
LRYHRKHAAADILGESFERKHFVATTAAIIAGSLAAAGAIGGAAISAHAAGSAADKQAAAADKAGTIGQAAANDAAGGITEAAAKAAEGVTGAAQAATSGVADATKGANGILADVLQRQTDLATPFLNLGELGAKSLKDALAPGGSLTTQFSFDPTQISQNPEYQFRLSEGMKAVQRSAAASGILNTGGTLKALDQYSQGLASDEIDKSYSRALTTFNTNRSATLSSIELPLQIGQNGVQLMSGALDKFGTTTANNDIQSALYGGNTTFLGAQQGNNYNFQGAQQSGNYKIAGASIGGNAAINMANAQAAGTVGAANAWSGGLSGATSAVSGAILAPLYAPSAVTPKPANGLPPGVTPYQYQG